MLTAIGLSSGGSSTVHIYTQTIHRTTQNKQYIEHNSTLSLTWALDVVGGQRHAPANLPPERTGTHCTGGWVGLRASIT